MRRRCVGGFTLIELLVVIAIIGILAAMVFPVFARARESARKAVCLSNVKNIGLAIQMYLADNNDTLWPKEHRQEVIDYFNTWPGGRTDMYVSEVEAGYCPIASRANPYLRPVVVLDEYVKNRDVWRCSSAKMVGGPNAIVPGPNWLASLQAGEGMWGYKTEVCVKDNVFPPGWGGDVTDSIVQQRMPGASVVNAAWGWGSGGANKVFEQSVAVNGEALTETKLAAVQDPVSWVACADGGSWSDYLTPGLVAYPDLCNPECGNCACATTWIDSDSCRDSVQSGSGCGSTDVWTCFTNWHTSSAMLRDKTLMKKGTRHLGGSNIGFLDGHASWMNAGSFLDKWADAAKPGRGLSAMGLDAWGPYSWCSSAETGGDYFVVAFPDEPTLR
jgi:prepilin-type N-terminal cleavage/methylation domain-containing protein/prepilin-type processing-associated H-X9-DG protein